MSVLADDDELVLVITQITEYPGMASHGPNWFVLDFTHGQVPPVLAPRPASSMSPRSCNKADISNIPRCIRCRFPRCVSAAVSIPPHPALLKPLHY